MHQGNEYSGYPGEDGTNGGYPAHGSSDFATGNPTALDPYAVGPDSTDPYSTKPPAEGYYATEPLAHDDFGPTSSSQDPRTPRTHGPTWAPGAVAASGAPIGGYYAPPAPTSGYSIAGFILGLASFVMCAGVPAPIGLVFSILGMRETSPTSPTVHSGRGLAIAGLVLNILGTLILGFMVLYFALLIVIGVTSQTS